MTVDELKTALADRDFPETVVIGPHQTVSNVPQFLRIQFIECELWKGDIEKCPAHIRLSSFYEAIKTI